MSDARNVRNPLKFLEDAIEQHEAQLTAYEQRSEMIVFETLRALDDVFCRELFETDKLLSDGERRARFIQGWGVNHALKRIMPLSLAPEAFRLFPSHETLQAQADDFLLKCGCLHLGERFRQWLREGLVHGEVREHEQVGLPCISPLVLKPNSPSLDDELIGRFGILWSSGRRVRAAQTVERELKRRQRDVMRELEMRCVLRDGWLPQHSTSDELDDYFSQAAAYYLDRIYAQDLIGPEDRLGGNSFGRYVEVIRELSGRAHQRLALAMVLKRRHPKADFRNLFTDRAPVDELEQWLAARLHGEVREIKALLHAATLSPANLLAHTESEDVAWAPIVRASEKTYMLPLYGLDINPFLFLLRSLRTLHEKDWFNAANEREGRWIAELGSIFAEKGYVTNPICKLRANGRVVTDIDYAAYNAQTNELLLFQLKWQQPIGVDNRGRRSTARNLITTGNKWLNDVRLWLEVHGLSALMDKLGFGGQLSPQIYMFVLARYNAHFSGHDGHNGDAVWSSWDNFRRALHHVPQGSARRIVAFLRRGEAEARRRIKHESLFFPLGDRIVVVNPSTEPPASVARRSN
jgi:hypothetical protein